MIIEIITIIAVVLFLSAVIGGYIYKKIKHIPTGDCAYCYTKNNRLLKDYRKKYKAKKA